MKIRYRLLSENAKVPTRGSTEAAGWDLYVTDYEELPGNLIRYSTGLSIEIPRGYVGLIFPRSSIFKLPLALSNAVGVIDSDYRGEIKFVFRRLPKELNNLFDPDRYKIGERAGQLVVVKHEELEFEEAQSLSETDRGGAGFGSTGT